MLSTQVKQSKAGFTLIELSIVLVIIGLIVGGILVGQDLIRAAEIRATVSQYEKYNSAVNTFRSKYNGIPGDLQESQAVAFGLFALSTAGTVGGAGMGDGNGLLEGGASAVTPLQGETALFWRHLSDASLVDGSFSPSANATTSGALTTAGVLATAVPGTAATTYIPPAKLGRGNYWQVGSASGYNYYMLEGVSAILTTGAQTVTANLTPSEAFNIDTKLDDGQPNTGTVQARGIIGSASDPASNFATLVGGNAASYTTGSPPGAGKCLWWGSTGTSTTANDPTNGYNVNVSYGGNQQACTLRLRFN